MQALIISEDEKVYSSLNESLRKAGYDTIIYKWLLKALDNIEEIQPDCIVVSSSEYPRHWKTLVQFVKSGIGGDNVDIYLYEPNPISQEDQEKAKILGITGYFESLESFNIPPVAAVETSAACEPTVVAEVDETPVASEPPVAAEPPVVAEPPIVTEPPVAAEPVEAQIAEVDADAKVEVEATPETPAIINSGHFIFTAPQSKKFVCGKFFDYNGKTLSCSFYEPADMENLSHDEVISAFTFFDSKVSRNASVVVKELVKILPSNPFVIVEIQEIYEQN